MNAVAPSYVATEMTRDMTDAHRERLKRRSALRRLPEAEDVAAAILYLFGEQALTITGTVMTVDRLMQPLQLRPARESRLQRIVERDRRRRRGHRTRRARPLRWVRICRARARAPSTCWTEVVMVRDKDGVFVVTPKRRYR